MFHALQVFHSVLEFDGGKTFQALVDFHPVYWRMGIGDINDGAPRHRHEQVLQVIHERRPDDNAHPGPPGGRGFDVNKKKAEENGGIVVIRKALCHSSGDLAGHRAVESKAAQHTPAGGGRLTPPVRARITR